MSSSPYHSTDTWTESIEDYIKSIQEDSEIASIKHHKMAIYAVNCRNLWSIPNILIPVILSPLTQTFKDDEFISYLSMCGFIVVGICASILQYFNYGQRSQANFDTESKFDDLVTDIKEILVKSNKCENSSTILRTIRMRYDTIRNQAPTGY